MSPGQGGMVFDPPHLGALFEFINDAGKSIIVFFSFASGDGTNNTGEGIYMTVADRKLVSETVMAQVNGRVPIIIHIGALVASDAVAVASTIRSRS